MSEHVRKTIFTTDINTAGSNIPDIFNLSDGKPKNYIFMTEIVRTA